MRCGKANSKILLPDHVVAVGLRCGKAKSKTPRHFARLDPVFPRDSSGCSIPFPIKEESTRLATSSPFSKMPNGQEPSGVGLLLLPTRAPLMKTPTRSAGPVSSSRTLTHMHQAASVPVEEDEKSTLPDGPVVTGRPLVRSAGRYCHKSTEESHLSSSRSSLEPPAPSGAVKSSFWRFFANERRGHGARDRGSGLAS